MKSDPAPTAELTRETLESSAAKLAFNNASEDAYIAFIATNELGNAYIHLYLDALAFQLSRGFHYEHIAQVYEYIAANLRKNPPPFSGSPDGVTKQ